MATDVSEEPTSSISSMKLLGLLVLAKCTHLYTKLHGVICHITLILYVKYIC